MKSKVVKLAFLVIVMLAAGSIANQASAQIYVSVEPCSIWIHGSLRSPSIPLPLNGVMAVEPHLQCISKGSGSSQESRSTRGCAMSAFYFFLARIGCVMSGTTS